MFTAALTTVEEYLAAFDRVEIPVLRRSMRALGALRENSDAVGGRALAAEVLQDPMLAMRVLTFLEANRPRRQNRDITTIERAIMMLGVEPFFARFAELPTVEAHLAAHPKALIGLLRVVSRAKHAAHWARELAILRHDIDVDEVTVAALLHEAAEILFWCFAPVCMLRVEALKAATPGLRTAVAQQQILNVDIREVQLALVRAWRLPELLVSLMDETHAESARVRNVVLACNLARHAANGWQDPALPDDYTAIAELVHMKRGTIMQRLGVPEEYWGPVQAAEAASN